LLSQSNPFHQKCGRAAFTFRVNELNPQKKVIQKKEQQTKTGVDVVVQNLQDFAIKKSIATRLAHDYPLDYIEEKLAMAQDLVATGHVPTQQDG
jgi:hypothetical protein